MELKRKQTFDDERKYMTMRSKSFFQELVMPAITNSSKNLLEKERKQIKKGWKKKICSINQVFDDYLNKLHFIYFQKVCENICKNSMDIIHASYNKQLNSYLKIDDQIEELLIMSKDDPNSGYSKSIDLMINNLHLEQEKKNFQISVQAKQDINSIIQKCELFELHDDSKINEVTDNLVKGLYNILNN